MLSIEEAWGNLTDEVYGEPGPLVHARALALAVLESEHSGSSVFRCNCTTWAEGDRCRDYKASRDRIEALGS